MTNYTRKALGGSAANFVMSFIASVIAYLTTVYLTRIFPVEEFGMFAAVFEFLSFFFFIRELGMNSAMVKYIMEHKAAGAYNIVKTSVIMTAVIQFASSTILVLGFYAFSNYLINDYFKSIIAWNILQILFIYLFLSVIFRIMKSVLQSYFRMTLSAAIEPLKNILTLLSIIVLFYFNHSVYILAWGYAISSLLLVIILTIPFIRTIEFFKHKVERIPHVSKTLIWIGVPFMVNGMSARIIASFDTIMLTKMKAMTEVGIYNAVLPTAMILLFFSQSISAVAFPIVADLWARKDLVRLKDGLRLLYKYFFVAVAPIIVTLMFYSSFFLEVVFGPSYVPGTLAFQILTFGVLLYMIAQINNSVIPAVTSPNVVTIIIAIAAGVNVTFNLILIPRFGIAGAAFATMMSYLVASVLTVRSVRKYVQFSVPFYAWLKTILALVVLVGAMYLFQAVIHFNAWGDMIINVSLSLIIYASLVYLLGLINLPELKKYWDLMMKKKEVQKEIVEESKP